jgi:hypothetical protein
MSKDAKLGLVLGIGLVIIIAVVFFRKDPVQARSPETSAAVKPKNAVPAPFVSDVRPAAKAAEQHWGQ